MRAWRYLKIIRNLQVIIEQRQKQIDGLKEKAQSIGSPSAFDKPGVRKQTAADPVGDRVAAYVDLQRDAERIIENAERVKDQIIFQIQSLNNPHHVELLFKEYVELKSIRQIAREMHYSFEYVNNKLRPDAVRAFEKKYAAYLKDVSFKKLLEFDKRESC